MDHLLLLLVWSSGLCRSLLVSAGLQAEADHSSTERDGVRLVGGHRRCAGALEVEHQRDWRPVLDQDFTLAEAAAACRELDCGSAVAVGRRQESSVRLMWEISSGCVQAGSALRDCVAVGYSTSILNLTCSDSVRLVNGRSLCSGRLEVRSHQSDQSDQSDQRWSSVCEADFDQQDAEVVCRELRCGAPSVFQGGLYGEVEAPVWPKQFECGGHESALLDCRSSDSGTDTCSPGRAVGLTCSEPSEVRLVGGDGRCAGGLELKHQGEWRAVSANVWTLNTATRVCKDLDCGSALAVAGRDEPSEKPLWLIRSDCVQAGFAVRECVVSWFSSYVQELTCSDSVRLVNGTSLCSGRLEVRFHQRWSSVCEAGFDLQDAEVVCRELDCGAPSALQGRLYGEVEAPVWTGGFQCGGHESALLDCRSSDSDTDTCSPGRAVGLTCSEPVRLVGGFSRCAGTLEVKRLGEWRPAEGSGWSVTAAAVACRELHCGSAVSQRTSKEASYRSVWMIWSRCVKSGSTLRECATSSRDSDTLLDLTCSDVLLQPSISASSPMGGVSHAQQQGFQVSKGSSFTVSCSVRPQYPGGSFQLSFTSSNTSRNYTQPAVNHSAHFLFHAAQPAHQGSYTCVYAVYLLSHNLTSESRLLTLSVSDPTGLFIRGVVLPLTLLLLSAACCCYRKVIRRQKPGRQTDTERDYYNLSIGAADGGAEGGGRS